jgi:hypothetical protein
MVFSKDVLANMLHDPRIFSKEIMKDNDDVSLSVLADPYSKWIDWNEHVCAMRGCPTDDKGLYLPEKIKPLENGKWIFRICEYDDNRKIDAKNWDVLLKYFNEYDIVVQFDETAQQQNKQQPKEKPKKKIQTWVVIFFIVCVVVFLLSLVRDKKKKLKAFHDNMKYYISKYRKMKR